MPAVVRPTGYDGRRLRLGVKRVTCNRAERIVLDFEIQRCTRHCAETNREFEPGETFYSVLIAEGADTVRRDYCQEAWKGPPENVLGWWKSIMPDRNANKVHWAPNDVMLHYFEQLEDRPDRVDTRYILALLMIRRRVVRLEETETNDSGREVMNLYCPRNEKQYEVVVDTPDEKRVDEIQQELAELLFSKAA